MGFKLDQFSQKLQKEIRGILNAQDSASLSRGSSQFQEQQARHNGKGKEKEGHVDNKTSLPKDNAGHGIAVPHSVGVKLYFSDKRRRDLDGSISTLLDCLVASGALVDDNRFCVPRITLEAFDCEKGQDRAVVVITQLEPPPKA